MIEVSISRLGGVLQQILFCRTMMKSHLNNHKYLVDIRRFRSSLVALEPMVLNGTSLNKLSGCGGCDRFCFASQLSNHHYKLKNISSTYFGFGARWWFARGNMNPAAARNCGCGCGLFRFLG